MVGTLHESAGGISIESCDCLRIAQYIMGQSGVREDALLEIVEYQFRRGVLVRIYLVQDDVALLYQFTFGERGAENHIAQKLYSALQVVGKYSCMDSCLVLGSISIQFAAHFIQAVEDLYARATFGAFEDSVLDKMGYAILVGVLIARAGTNNQATMAHATMSSLHYYTDAIGESCDGEFGHGI